MEKASSTILAFGGRRVDAPGEVPMRFPAEQIQTVRQRVETAFIRENVSQLVSSAACGADLIALHVAQTLGIPFRIILPFSVERFRETSVVDPPRRSGWNWGNLYDAIIKVALGRNALRILEDEKGLEPSYAGVNQALVQEAMSLGAVSGLPPSSSGPDLFLVKAMIVWDGSPRGPKDLTVNFAEEARSHNLPVIEVLTFS